MKTLLVALTALITTPLLCTANTGEELWMENCKKCHGEEGKGDTAMGKRFSILDYTDPAVQESFTDEAIKTAIVDGKKNEDGRKVMLAFGNKLSEEEVDTLTAYVRSLAKE